MLWQASAHEPEPGLALHRQTSSAPAWQIHAQTAEQHSVFHFALYSNLHELLQLETLPIQGNKAFLENSLWMLLWKLWKLGSASAESIVIPDHAFNELHYHANLPFKLSYLNCEDHSHKASSEQWNTQRPGAHQLQLLCRIPHMYFACTEVIWWPYTQAGSTCVPLPGQS